MADKQIVVLCPACGAPRRAGRACKNKSCSDHMFGVRVDQVAMLTTRAREAIFDLQRSVDELVHRLCQPGTREELAERLRAAAHHTAG